MTITTVDPQQRSGRRLVIGTVATAAIVGIVALGVSARPGSNPSPEQTPQIRRDPRSYVAELVDASPQELAAAFGNIHNPYATATDQELAAAFGNLHNPYATATDQELAAAFGNLHNR